MPQIRIAHPQKIRYRFQQEAQQNSIAKAAIANSRLKSECKVGKKIGIMPQRGGLFGRLRRDRRESGYSQLI